MKITTLHVKILCAFILLIILAPIRVSAQTFGEQPSGLVLKRFNHFSDEGSKSKKYRQQDIHDLLAEMFPNVNNELQRLSSTETTNLQDIKYIQYFKGVKVEHSAVTAHFKNGELTSITGMYVSIPDSLSVNPAMASNEAIRMLELKLAEDKSIHVSLDNSIKPELVICERMDNSLNGEPHLSYKFIFQDKQQSRWYTFYVDANTGDRVFVDQKHRGLSNNSNHVLEGKVDNIELEEEGMQEVSMLGTFHTKYYGTQQNVITTLSNGKYILKDLVRNIETKTSNNFLQDNDNVWTSGEYNNAQQDNGSLDAHWAVQKTYDYFNIKHERKGFDGVNGMAGSKITVRTQFSFGENPALYGNGTLTFRTMDHDMATTLDIVAHEFTHGIDANTAGLLSASEPGALEESFPDMFGACVENYAAPYKNIWVAGNDQFYLDNQPNDNQFVNTLFSAPYFLRSMSNPKSTFQFNIETDQVGERYTYFLKQPDTYKGTYWDADLPGCSLENPLVIDPNCGERYVNMGVPNHWFYILSQGKQGVNDIDSAYNVTGIGIEKAGKIAYRTLTSYMHPKTSFLQARIFSIWAAEDLYGEGSPEAISTANAWHAVGVGLPYGQATCDVPTGLSSSQSGNYITFTWDPVDWAASYTFFYRKKGSWLWQGNSGVHTNSIIKNVGPQTNGTIYEWKVKAICENGESTYTNVREHYYNKLIIIIAQMANEEPNSLGSYSNDKFIVYPNPGNDNISFFNNEKILQVQIYDQIGRECSNIQTDLATHTIDVSQLPTGVYLIIGRTEDSEVITKFIKQ